MPDDRWRDSYDNWKLATPPEYEEEQSEESMMEEDMWRDGVPREESDKIMASHRAEQRRARMIESIEALAEANRRFKSDPPNIDEEIPF